MDQAKLLEVGPDQRSFHQASIRVGRVGLKQAKIMFSNWA